MHRYSGIFLSWGALVAFATTVQSAFGTLHDAGPMRHVEFDVEEGTWLNLDVSPDGKTILFDLLGDLYTLPIEGGTATLLVGGRQIDQMPRFSPDGRRIAFISDRDGQLNLWVAHVDGSEPQQISRERNQRVLLPSWTPDGAAIAARVSEGAWLFKGQLRLYPADGVGAFSDLQRQRSAYGTAVFSSDGRYAYFSDETQLKRMWRDTGDVRAITPAGFIVGKPQLSPNGRWLVYGRKQGGATALWIRDLIDGTERELLENVEPDDSWPYLAQDFLPNYAFTPDGQSIVLPIDGKIWRVAIDTADRKPIPFRAHVSQLVAEPIRVAKRTAVGDVPIRVLRWLSIARDSKRLAFGAIGQVWTAALPGGAPVHLTGGGERRFFPALSPDGKWVAYTTWSDKAGGHLMVAPIEGGTLRQLTPIPGHYASPAWSHDGTKIAFLRGSGVELRHLSQSHESYYDLLWADAAHGSPQYVTTLNAMGDSFSPRFHSTLSWGLDGARIYFVEHVAPAGPDSKDPAVGDWLRSVRVDGQDRRSHVHARYGEELVPSPDGSRLLIGRNNEIWLAEMPDGLETLELDFSDAAVPARRISSEGGIAPVWIDDSTASWAFNGKFWSYRLGARAPQVLLDPKLSVPRARPSGVIAFRHATIVTMKGNQVLTPATVVVRGDRIVAVGPDVSVRIPAGVTVVDATGKTIVPGLIDVHAHMNWLEDIVPEEQWPYVIHLAYGVTSTFDPSASPLDVFTQSDMVAAGLLLGPRIFSSGRAMSGGVDYKVDEVTDAQAARQVLHRLQTYGMEMFKEYLRNRRDERQWLSQAARELHIAVTAEGSSLLAFELSRILDGYTAIEHQPMGPVWRQDMIELVARTGTHLTPTLIAFDGDRYFYAKTDFFADTKLRRFTPEWALEPHRRGTNRPDDEWLWPRGARSSVAVVKAGGRVSVGGHGNRQGLGTHWELWLLQRGGLTPLEALRAATLTGAVKLGRERDLGSIEVGKLADFLVLTANPLDDICNTTSIQYTVANGFVYDAQSMARVWPDYRPAPTFSWQTEQERAPFAAPIVHSLQ